MGNCEYTPNSNSEKKCAWKQCEKETDRGRLSTLDKSTEQNHSNVKEKLAIRKSTQCWEQWFRKQKKKKKGKVNSWGVDFEYLAVSPHFLSKLLLMAKFFKISSSCKHVTPFRSSLSSHGLVNLSKRLRQPVFDWKFIFVATRRSQLGSSQL